MEISSPTRPVQLHGTAGTQKLNLTIAISQYEHVADVMSGLIRPQGIEITPLTLPIENIAYRHFRNHEFDVAETSFAKYIATVAAGNSPIIGIPVFPARLFRLSSLYIRKDAGISAPKDFEGRTVGIPEWAQTAGVYVRGCLSEYFGVAVNRINWIQAGVNEPGRVEKVTLNLPPDIRYGSRPDTCLNEMLLSGELDAAFTARPPDSFLQGDPRIMRLFPDFRVQEAAYFAATGIFPIMHLLTIRRSVLDAYPWVAMNLFTAFEEAKDAAVRRVLEITTSRIPLPWGVAHAEEVAKLMGGDLWPYGVASNLNTLNAFCRFAHNQYITPTLLRVEDLFPKEVIGRFKV
jgi:4,5-dihydroxyphthalate decarboxylase